MSSGKEVKAEYDEDSALFMLGAMFNQFSLGEIGKAFKASKQNYYVAMENLLDLQAKTGKRPKLAMRPRPPRRGLLGLSKCRVLYSPDSFILVLG